MENPEVKLANNKIHMIVTNQDGSFVTVEFEPWEAKETARRIQKLVSLLPDTFLLSNSPEATSTIVTEGDLQESEILALKNAISQNNKVIQGLEQSMAKISGELERERTEYRNVLADARMHRGRAERYYKTCRFLLSLTDEATQEIQNQQTKEAMSRAFASIKQD